MYRRIFTAVVNTHRPVVLEFHLHHGLEHAILDPIRHIVLSHLVVEVVVELACCRWVGRIVEVGLVAFFHLAIQGELGDWYNISAADREILVA